jgi:hypothetical protein
MKGKNRKTYAVMEKETTAPAAPWSCLNSDESQILRYRGITNELFEACFKLVKTTERKDRIGVSLILPGFPMAISAWWNTKGEALENTKAYVVFQLLSVLKDDKIGTLKQIYVDQQMLKDWIARTPIRSLKNRFCHCG